MNEGERETVYKSVQAPLGLWVPTPLFWNSPPLPPADSCSHRTALAL